MTFTDIAVLVRCDQCGAEQRLSCDADAFFCNCDFLANAGWGYIEAGGRCLDICPACMEAAESDALGPISGGTVEEARP